MFNMGMSSQGGTELGGYRPAFNQPDYMMTASYGYDYDNEYFGGGGYYYQGGTANHQQGTFAPPAAMPPTVMSPVSMPYAAMPSSSLPNPPIPHEETRSENGIPHPTPAFASWPAFMQANVRLRGEVKTRSRAKEAEHFIPARTEEVGEQESGSGEAPPVTDEGAEFWRSAPQRTEKVDICEVDVAPAVPTGRTKMSRLEQLRAKNNSVWRPAVCMDRGPNSGVSRRAEGRAPPTLKTVWKPPGSDILGVLAIGKGPEPRQDRSASMNLPESAPYVDNFQQQVLLNAASAADLEDVESLSSLDSDGEELSIPGSAAVTPRPEVVSPASDAQVPLEEARKARATKPALWRPPAGVEPTHSPLSNASEPASRDMVAGPSLQEKAAKSQDSPKLEQIRKQLPLAQVEQERDRPLPGTPSGRDRKRLSASSPVDGGQPESELKRPFASSPVKSSCPAADMKCSSGIRPVEGRCRSSDRKRPATSSQGEGSCPSSERKKSALSSPLECAPKALLSPAAQMNVPRGKRTKRITDLPAHKRAKLQGKNLSGLGTVQHGQIPWGKRTMSEGLAPQARSFSEPSSKEGSFRPRKLAPPSKTPNARKRPVDEVHRMAPSSLPRDGRETGEKVLKRVKKDHSHFISTDRQHVEKHSQLRKDVKGESQRKSTLPSGALSDAPMKRGPNNSLEPKKSLHAARLNKEKAQSTPPSALKIRIKHTQGASSTPSSKPPLKSKLAKGMKRGIFSMSDTSSGVISSESDDERASMDYGSKAKAARLDESGVVSKSKGRPLEAGAPHLQTGDGSSAPSISSKPKMKQQGIGKAAKGSSKLKPGHVNLAPRPGGGVELRPDLPAVKRKPGRPPGSGKKSPLLAGGARKTEAQPAKREAGLPSGASLTKPVPSPGASGLGVEKQSVKRGPGRPPGTGKKQLQAAALAANRTGSPKISAEPSFKATVRFNPGEVVWAKMSSFPWWPAQVQVPASPEFYNIKHAEEDYFVVFYGDSNYKWLPPSHVRPFHSDYLKHSSSKNRSLQSAVDSAWEAIGKARPRLKLGDKIDPNLFLT